MRATTHGSGMWGGRFEGPPAESLRVLNRSFPFDCRLAAVDVEGSIAYAAALHAAGWLETGEHEAIVSGLTSIAEEFSSGSFVARPEDEDIHTAVERRLYERIGPTAGKLHTGRSRNDQVATDLRLYLLRGIDGLVDQIRILQTEIVARATAHLEGIMPGFTHLQPAQPVLFSHWMMSHFWKLERDIARLRDARVRTNECPLGSGAIAGNPFGIDRARLAASLGFDAPTDNSLDAIEDRDFVCETLFSVSMLQVHLSSLAETLILWASRAFGFVRLHESHCTGSSLMPQKRNPDALELVRGKTGRVCGHLSALLTTLKGLPSGYNKDLQEDKEGLFDAMDTLRLELPVLAEVIGRMEVDVQRMAGALDPGLLATDLADYLVRKGIPFRDAHQVVGSIVREAETKGVSIRDLPLEAYRGAHTAFDGDVFDLFDVRAAVARRASAGGTAPTAVEAQIRRANEILDTAGRER